MRPKCCCGAVDQCTDLIRVGDVGGNRQCAAPEFAYARGGLLATLGNDVTDHDVRANRRIRECDCSANSAATAGDNGDLVGKKDVGWFQRDAPLYERDFNW